MSLSREMMFLLQIYCLQSCAWELLCSGMVLNEQLLYITIVFNVVFPSFLHVYILSGLKVSHILLFFCLAIPHLNMFYIE